MTKQKLTAKQADKLLTEVFKLLRDNDINHAGVVTVEDGEHMRNTISFTGYSGVLGPAISRALSEAMDSEASGIVWKASVWHAVSQRSDLPLKVDDHKMIGALLLGGLGDLLERGSSPPPKKRPLKPKSGGGNVIEFPTKP